MGTKSYQVFNPAVCSFYSVQNAENKRLTGEREKIVEIERKEVLDVCVDCTLLVFSLSLRQKYVDAKHDLGHHFLVLSLLNQVRVHGTPAQPEIITRLSQ